MTRFSYNLCLIMFVLILSAAALAVSGPAYAQDEAPAVTAALSGQLTIEDLQTLNDNKAEIFIHDGRVTFVDGTCTADPVKSVEDAEKVAASMFGLLGGNSGTQFDYWRTLTDASGNKYYVFQQMYSNVSVLGGAVKVITDADGNMIGFTSSVGTELPDIEASEGITVEEAEQAVLRYAAEMNQPEPTVLFPTYSTVPDQQVLAIYLAGKWYLIEGIDLAGEKEYTTEELAEMNKDNHIVEDLVANLLNNLGNIHSFDDFLDLFTLNIPGGGVVELSSEGLGDVVLPEPSEDRPDDEAPAEPQEPGKK